jgi:acetoin utilization protein AcuB
MRPTVQSYTSRDLIVASWTDPVQEAYTLMHRKGIRHLPVADDDGYIIGVLSDRDVARAMLRGDSREGTPPGFNPTDAVGDYMSWPVESIHEDASIGDAARLMIDKKISALLVLQKGEVRGIVTTEDLLRALLVEAEGPARKAIESVEGAVAQSPIGQIAQALANAGV